MVKGRKTQHHSSHRCMSDSTRLNFEPLEDRCMLATLTVNVNWDGDVLDDGNLMLREALAVINGSYFPDEIDGDKNQINESVDILGDNDKILFSTDPLDGLDGATITFADGFEYNSLYITNSVTIDATALPNGITIDANNGFDHDPDTFDGASVFSIEPDTSSGEDHQVTLAGLTITGGNTGSEGGGIRYFYNNASAEPDLTLTIIDTQIEGNHVQGNGGGVYVWTFAKDTLQINISGSTIEENKAYAGGGAYISGPTSVVISDTNFIDNQAIGSTNTGFGSGGGGLFCLVDAQGIQDKIATLTITDSEFYDNKALGSIGVLGGGGGLHVWLRGADDPTRATLNLINSTVSGNEATNCDGGGVWVNAKYGTFNAIQSTISGNSALFGKGGGLWITSYYDLINREVVSNLDHNTITNNFSPNGGGLYSDPKLGVITTLNHTIVSGNRTEELHTSVANNISGSINVADSKFNLVGKTGGVYPLLQTNGNKHDADNNPGLMELAYYGGPTKTHMPEGTSEVINEGDPNAAPWPNGLPRYDQRGRPFDRVFDEDGDPGTPDIIDIGAVEYGIGDPTGAPRVVDIVISGSNSVHDEYSFSEAFDEGTHEFTTVPVGGADTIEIVFSEHIDDIVPNSLFLQSGYTGILYTSDGSDAMHWKVVDYFYDVDTFIARWRFDGPDEGDAPDPFPADQLAIRLGRTQASVLHDVDNNALDGEWAFPRSIYEDFSTIFPSGNGYEGGGFIFTFVILPGDADLDNDVDGSDYLLWLSNFDPNETGKTFEQGDFNGDGIVEGEDLAIWQENFDLDFSTWGLS
jgi:hypothetical protein